jgi:hypothetical protein
MTKRNKNGKEPTQTKKVCLRPGAESNRRIRVLQTLALPLGDQAILNMKRKD